MKRRRKEKRTNDAFTKDVATQYWLQHLNSAYKCSMQGFKYYF